MKNLRFSPDLLEKLKKAELRKKGEDIKKTAQEKEKIESEEKKRLEFERRIKSKKHNKLVDFILDWIFKFVNSHEGKRLLNVSKRITLLWAKFFNGEPVSADDVHLNTGIDLSIPVELDPNRKIIREHNMISNEEVRFICTEKYKNSHEILNMRIDDRNAKTHILGRLHPKMIEELAGAIKSGKVNEFIKNSLPT